MDALIQQLHPALRLGQRLVLADSGAPLFSRQGDWDGGSTLHCVAMALALLGRLSDPVGVRHYRDGPEAAFWDRAWLHYLHGLTLSDLVSFIWELNIGVRPVAAHGSPATVLRFCQRELAKGWPVIVNWQNRRPPRRHVALAIGVEGRRRERVFAPHALLLLDPAEAEPKLTAFNARMEFAKAGGSPRPRCTTATATRAVTIDGAVSIRLLGRPP